MVSIFFKIEMALLHGIDYIVRNKQENVRQYEMEVFRMDEFFQSLTTNLFSQFQGERRRKPEMYVCAQIVPGFRLHCLVGLGLSLLQNV